METVPVTFKILNLIVLVSLALFSISLNSFAFSDGLEFSLVLKSIFFGIGSTMCVWRAYFFQWRRTEISDLIDEINNHSQDLRLNSDPKIRKLRSQFISKEMVLMLTAILTLTFLAVAFGLEAILHNRFPFPALYPFDTTPFGIGYLCAFAFQIITFQISVLNTLLTEALLGNLYNQIVLNFKVLNMRLESLGNGQDSASRSKEMVATIIKIVIKYNQLQR